MDKAGYAHKRMVDQQSQEIAARVVLHVGPTGRKYWER